MSSITAEPANPDASSASRRVLHRRGGLGRALVQGTFGQAGILGINLLTGLILARLLGPQGRGEVAAINLAPSFFSALAGLGLTSGFVYYARRATSHRLIGALFGHLLLLQALTSIVAAGLGWFLVPHWLEGSGPQVIQFARYYCVTAVLVAFGASVSAAYAVRDEFGRLNLFQFGQAALYLGLLGLLAWLDELTPQRVVLLQTAAGLTLLTTSLAYLVPRLKPNLHRPRFALARLFGYGLRTYAGSIVERLGRDFEKILIAGVLSLADLGLFVVACSVSSMGGLLRSIMAPVLMPKLASSPNDEQRHATLRTMMALSSSCGTVAAVAVIAATPIMLPIIYGTEFSDAVYPAVVITARMPMAAVVATLQSGLNGFGRPGLVSGCTGLRVAANVGLLIVLVPFRGVNGAAEATLLCTIVTLIVFLSVYPLILRRNVPTPDFASLLRLIAQRLRMLGNRE